MKMRSILFLSVIVSLLFLSCGVNDEGDTGNTGNTGDTGDTGDTTDTGEIGRASCRERV